MHPARTGLAALVAMSLSVPVEAALPPVPRTLPRLSRTPIRARTARAPGPRAVTSLAGPNGEILYAYGAGHPEVRCAPLHLCIVTLLAGEKIVDLSIGDSVRWLVQPARAGTRPIVIIKPITTGIETNLVITTDDGHLYDLNLVSGYTRVVPEVGFYDPKALIQAVANAQARKAEQAQRVVATLPRINPAKLEFAYWWTGPRAYRPVRVFAAAGKVYIQMPTGLRHGDAPAVFVVAHGTQALVNYQPESRPVSRNPKWVRPISGAKQGDAYASGGPRSSWSGPTLHGSWSVGPSQ